jgi:hypothetical protein
MLRSFWLCLFWMIVATCVPARADVLPFYSQLGTVNAPGGSLDNVSALNAIGGAIYVNSMANTSGVSTMSLGVLPISNATLSGGGLGIPSFGAGNIGVMVLGIQGQTTMLGSVPAAQFTTGVAQVYSVPLASFSTANPASWTNGTLLASYSLALAADALQGAPAAQAINFPQAIINTITANSTSGNQAQGRLLFNEIGNQNFFNATTFDSYGAASAISPEQLLLDIGETIQVPQGALPSEYQASVAALDALAMLLGLSSFSSYGAFNPLDPSSSYDYAAAFNGRLIPGMQQEPPLVFDVPEPASLLVWGTMMIAGLGVFKARKRKVVA